MSKELLEDIKRNFEVMTSEEKEWLIEQVERAIEPGVELELLNDEITRLEQQNKRYRETIDKTLHKCDLADDTGHDYTDEIRYELRKALEESE